MFLRAEVIHCCCMEVVCGTEHWFIALHIKLRKRYRALGKETIKRLLKKLDGTATVIKMLTELVSCDPRNNAVVR